MNQLKCDVIKELKDIIKEQLNDKLYNLLNLSIGSLYEIIHEYGIEIDKESVNDREYLKGLLINIFNKEPCIVLWRIIDDIKKVKISRKINGIDTEEDYREYKFKVYDNIKIRELYKVIAMDNLQVFNNINGELEKIDFLKYKFGNINLFEKSVFLDGEFKRVNNISIWDVEYMEIFVGFDAYGVDKNIPLYLNYIIDGCINHKYNNETIAFFNLYAALNNFIEVIYNDTFNFYIEKYSYYKEYIEELYSEEYDEIKQKLVMKYTDEFLKEKIRKFSNERIKLIDGKLKAVTEELGLYNKLKELIKKMKELDLHRNEIAHGDELTIDINFGEILYDVLSIIFSIIRGDDLANNDLTDLIENDIE